jgi:hypothetical protein
VGTSNESSRYGMQKGGRGRIAQARVDKVDATGVILSSHVIGLNIHSVGG